MYDNRYIALVVSKIKLKHVRCEIVVAKITFNIRVHTKLECKAYLSNAKEICF